jgi:tetratricopeptide (TPR) repeat protein
LSTNLIADELLNKIKIHFQNNLVIERTKLENCIKAEGFFKANIINTSCEITDSLLKSLLILDEKNRNINIFDALGDDRFENYKNVKSSKLIYPRYAQSSGIQGRQILSFTIENDGSITNIHSVRGNGKNIKTKNAKHAFTFIMGGIDLPDRIIRVQELLNDQNLDLAESISIDYVDTDILFKFLLGKIYMTRGDNDRAIKYFRSFLYSTNTSEYNIPKPFLVEAYGFLIEMLFKKNDFNAIAELEEDLSYNIRYESKTYDTVFSITYFYIGASLLNIGNVDSGLYYLVKSKRGTSNQALRKIINQNLKIVADQL